MRQNPAVRSIAAYLPIGAAAGTNPRWSDIPAAARGPGDPVALLAPGRGDVPVTTKDGRVACVCCYADGRLETMALDRGWIDGALGRGARPGWEALNPRLDQGAVETLAAIGATPADVSAASWNWLLGWREAAKKVSPQAADWRRQATLAYPLLPWIVTDIRRFDRQRGSQGQTSAKIEAAIDEGRSLSDALREHFGVAAWAVRRLNGLRLADIVLEGCGAKFQLGALISNLRHVEPAHCPATPAQWEALRSLANLAWQAIGPGPVPTETRFALRDKVIRSARGKWDALDSGRMRGAGLSDVAKDVAANLVAPFLAHGGPRGPLPDGETVLAVAHRLLLWDRAAPRLLETSAWWHDRHADAHRRLAAAWPRRDADWKPSWEPITPLFAAPGGWTVRPLTTAAALAEEGDALEHCVAGYWDDCAYGDQHILSVRAPSGRRVSTVQIDQAALRRAVAGRGDPDEAVVQHHAYDNADPPREANRAVAEWLAAAVARRLPIDFPALSAALARRETERPDLGEALGELWDASGPPAYDPARAEAREAAFAEYAALLPKRARQAGPAGFAALLLDMSAPDWTPWPRAERDAPAPPAQGPAF